MAARRTQQTRKCEFCGCSRTTQEHILPRSWAPIFGMAESPPPGHSFWLVHAVHEPLGDGPAARLIDQKRAKRPAVTTRAFCQACQGKWMRELDEAVRPMIEALASLHDITLHSEQQAALAAWAAKDDPRLLYEGALRAPARVWSRRLLSTVWRRAATASGHACLAGPARARRRSLVPSILGYAQRRPGSPPRRIRRRARHPPTGCLHARPCRST